jgi:hypothetical protein
MRCLSHQSEYRILSGYILTRRKNPFRIISIHNIEKLHDSLIIEHIYRQYANRDRDTAMSFPTK